MSRNPALVAQGGVVLERKLDFQAFYLEETVRIRILSQAGVAAAEFTSLPARLQFLEGQVTLPDGTVHPIGKREDFLVRKVVSTVDGTVKEGVLIPPGLTPDCVLELRWREATERGMARLHGSGVAGTSPLPEAYGDFWYWTLAGSLPTETCVVQQAKEFDWPLIIMGAKGYDLKEGSTSQGKTYTFSRLPAVPGVPYSLPVNNPSPKILVHRHLVEVAYRQANAPAVVYWQKVTEVFYKDWFLESVIRRQDFDALSLSLRQGLTGGPQERARAIAERLGKRIINAQELFYDEKVPFLVKASVGGAGQADLEAAARTGFSDYRTLPRILFHVLADAGLNPKVGLVANRYSWVVNPEVRTPYQFSHMLLGVDAPESPTLWLDPTDRMVPPGQVRPGYQGTRAVVIDTPSWQTSIQGIPVAEPAANERRFAYRLEVKDEACAVSMEVSHTGAKALAARDHLGEKSPSQREAWFKEQLEGRGLTISKLVLANALDLDKPLVYKAEGTLPVDPGRQLRIKPFPGMDAGLFLPATLEERRQDAILMPHLGIQAASSTVKVPSGYRLPAPVSVWHSNQWGRVSLTAIQDAATGDLTVAMEVKTVGFVARADAYASFKNFLEWVREVTAQEITLEKDPGVKS